MISIPTGCPIDPPSHYGMELLNDSHNSYLTIILNGMRLVFNIQARKNRRCQHTLDDGFKDWVSSLLGGIHHRKPSLTVISMRNHADGLPVGWIDQQHHHLAITLVGAMVGARAVVHDRPGNLEVECTQDLQTCLAQPVRYPVNRLIAGYVQRQESGISIHLGEAEGFTID